MENHKVTSMKDEKGFVITDSFLKICKKLKSLKNTKGRLILIIGAPGTGKSSNIYNALDKLNLNIYEPILLMDSIEKSPKEVFNEVLNTIKEELNVKTNDEMYREFSKFDVVLVADKFLDSEFLDPYKTGLALWTEYKGFKSIPFFFFWIFEYLIHKKDLKKVNLVFQTAWTVRIRGFKYDLITDFGPFSKLLLGIFKLLFEVVEVSYSEKETIEIVKNHFKDVDDEQVRLCIKKYGNKPRYILDDLGSKINHGMKNPDQ